MIIVSDVGGEFDALQALIGGHKKAILVGDLHDRGPKSREVIEWTITHQSWATTLDSNHGDLFTDFYEGIKVYHHGDFLRNGGYHTLISYGMPVPTGNDLDVRECIKFARENVPKEHIEFLKTRPVFIEQDDLIVSHAPMPHPRYLVDDLTEMRGFSGDLRFNWIWNRRNPAPIEGKWQVFGHNSSPPRSFEEHCWGLTINEEEKWMCLDDSRSEKLTGVIWPERKIVQKSFARSRPSVTTKGPDAEAN